VRVFAHKQRASYSLAVPVFADGLSNGKDMRLGKRGIRAGAAMPACAEVDELIGSAGSKGAAKTKVYGYVLPTV
jgi:hypothetical protein